MMWVGGWVRRRGPGFHSAHPPLTPLGNAKLWPAPVGVKGVGKVVFGQSMDANGSSPVRGRLQCNYLAIWADQGPNVRRSTSGAHDVFLGSVVLVVWASLGPLRGLFGGPFGGKAEQFGGLFGQYLFSRSLFL